MKELKADWPALKRSFERLITLFPIARNKSAFASFACMADDIETFAALDASLGHQQNMSGWGCGPNGESPTQLLANCQTLAATPSAEKPAR